MPKFWSEGFRNRVEAETMDEAAERFGAILAKRVFSRIGYCHHAHLETRNDTGSNAVYSVQLCRPIPGHAAQCVTRYISIYHRGD